MDLRGLAGTMELYGMQCKGLGVAQHGMMQSGAGEGRQGELEVQPVTATLPLAARETKGRGYGAGPDLEGGLQVDFHLGWDEILTHGGAQVRVRHQQRDLEGSALGPPVHFGEGRMEAVAVYVDARKKKRAEQRGGGPHFLAPSAFFFAFSAASRAFFIGVVSTLSL